MTTIPIRDIPLYVKVFGRGYPLLLMHGGPGADHISMLAFRPLADRFTLILYDHRCNGRSVGPPVESMTWDNLTADAEALRQALGFERWAVLGHSFGGMVAQEYAFRYPQNLSHLLLVDTCGDTWWVQENAPELLAKRGFSRETVEAARRFYNGQIEPEKFMSTMMRLAKAYYHHAGPLLMFRETRMGMQVKARPEAQIFAFSQLLKGWSTMDRLDQIGAPTLVLAGRDDFQFPSEHQVMLANGIPNARLEIIERAGHNAPTERPAEVMAAVRRFFADHEPGPSPGGDEAMLDQLRGD